MEYLTIGFFLVIFVIQLIILWYQFWTYSSLYDQQQDIKDMLVTMNSLQENKTNKENKTGLKRIKSRVNSK